MLFPKPSRIPEPHYCIRCGSEQDLIGEHLERAFTPEPTLKETLIDLLVGVRLKLGDETIAHYLFVPFCSRCAARRRAAARFQYISYGLALASVIIGFGTTVVWVEGKYLLAGVICGLGVLVIGCVCRDHTEPRIVRV